MIIVFLDFLKTPGKNSKKYHKAIQKTRVLKSFGLWSTFPIQKITTDKTKKKNQLIEKVHILFFYFIAVNII